MDSLPGGMGLPQLVQVTKDRVVCLSVINYISCGLNCKASLYLLCSIAQDSPLIPAPADQSVRNCLAETKSQVY